jgi:predicted GNAT superfamily acetyltransferase/catechol 2,3-dioxygenase-like lactoylglutathione lyase family enzyme
MKLLRLAHVNLSVDDVAAARRFYLDTLGLEPIARPPGAARDGCWFRLGDLELHLSEEPVDNAGSQRHIAIEVDDIDAWRGRLGPVEEGRPLPGIRRFFVRDPAGNRLELYQRQGRAGASLTVRELTPADLPAVLALNNAHAAEVNCLTLPALEQALAMAARARLIGEAPGLGFVIAWDESTPDQGPNHAWFLARQRAFVYIDRVVIAEAARGRGLGRRLYHDLSAFACGRPLCCEVNLEPRNRAGLAFHERLGFQSCGEAVDPRNGKRVRYLVRRDPID